MKLAGQVVGTTLLFLGLRVAQVALTGKMEGLWWLLEAVRWGVIGFVIVWVHHEMVELRARLDAIRSMALDALQDTATLDEVSRQG